MASPIITPLPVQTDTNYRPISRMAVIGLILSLFSAFIFASDSLFWILFVVALPAFILCSLAWKAIRDSQGNLAGEPLAVLGIVISVACGLGWLTMTTVSKYVTQLEARAAADAFIDKLQKGEAGAAYLMRVPPGARLLDFNPEEYGRLRKHFPGQQQEISDFDNFLIDDACGQLLRYGDQMKVQYLGLVEAKSVRETPIFRFSYLYQGPAKEGFFIISARGEDYNGPDGIRREWVLSIDPNENISRTTTYGEELRIQGHHAVEAFDKFIAAVAHPNDPSSIQKVFDPKDQGELQTVIGYIRPKDYAGKGYEIKARKPMRLRADKKTDKTFTLTYDCTTIINNERAVDFSVDYVADLDKPEKSTLRNCRFLGTRKLMAPPAPQAVNPYSPRVPTPGQAQ